MEKNEGLVCPQIDDLNVEQILNDRIEAIEYAHPFALKAIEEHYIGREFTANDLWNGYENDDVHTVKVVAVETEGEFVDLILNDEKVLVDRLRWLEEEFQRVSGYPEASFTEIGAMREGALRFALWGW